MPFRTTFPYLAAAQGTPPLPSGPGRLWNFRTDPESAFVRVDRMGMPAVATALVGSSNKNAYNDDSPEQDVQGGGKWAGEFAGQLTTLTNALADDLKAAGLTPCATPVTP